MLLNLGETSSVSFLWHGRKRGEPVAPSVDNRGDSYAFVSLVNPIVDEKVLHRHLMDSFVTPKFLIRKRIS